MPLPDVDRLRREWTGRQVTVASEKPALRRFLRHLGTVVTVNMNGRALVRFDIPADFGWYDIALSDLQEASPAPEQTAAKPAGEPPAASAVKPEVRSAPSPKPADTPKMSILELARRQGAAKS